MTILGAFGLVCSLTAGGATVCNLLQQPDQETSTEESNEAVTKIGSDSLMNQVLQVPTAILTVVFKGRGL